MLKEHNAFNYFIRYDKHKHACIKMKCGESCSDVEPHPSAVRTGEAEKDPPLFFCLAFMKHIAPPTGTYQFMIQQFPPVEHKRIPDS